MEQYVIRRPHLLPQKQKQKQTTLKFWPTQSSSVTFECDMIQTLNEILGDEERRSEICENAKNIFDSVPRIAIIRLGK